MPSKKSQPIVNMPTTNIRNLKYTAVKTIIQKGHKHITKAYRLAVNDFWKRNVTDSKRWKKINLNLPEGYVYDNTNKKIIRRTQMYKINGELRKKYKNDVIYQNVLVTKEQKHNAIGFQQVNLLYH
mgnify:CR=1 FL=1